MSTFQNSKDFCKYVNTWQNCTKCEIACSTKVPFLHPPSYESIQRVDMMFVYEMPLTLSDTDTTQMERVGKAASWAYTRRETELKLLGIKIKPPTYIATPVIMCIPYMEKRKTDTSDEEIKLRTPTNDEADNCSFHLKQIYAQFLPRIVLPIGRVAWRMVTKLGYLHPDLSSCYKGYLNSQSTITNNPSIALFNENIDYIYTALRLITKEKK